MLTRVEQVAKTDATVLLQGETGVGKELIARAIHERSSRSNGPYVKVNCATLPEALVESELFGHEKGAFTGADRQRKGRFELADGGTILLDEVGELPPGTQVKLLRVLQEGEFERVGGSSTIKVSVRVIAATNRKLHDEVSAGRFRQDLFYRLNVYPITIPPLRQRREDIPLLVSHYARQIGERLGKSISEVPAQVMREFTEYNWPGNIRELQNVIERAVIVSSDGVLRLPEPLVQTTVAPAGEGEAFKVTISTLDEAEREHILRALEATGWRIEGPKGAAAMLRLHPSTLRFRMKKLGLTKVSQLYAASSENKFTLADRGGKSVEGRVSKRESRGECRGSGVLFGFLVSGVGFSVRGLSPGRNLNSDTLYRLAPHHSTLFHHCAKEYSKQLQDSQSLWTNSLAARLISRPYRRPSFPNASIGNADKFHKFHWPDDNIGETSEQILISLCFFRHLTPETRNPKQDVRSTILSSVATSITSNFPYPVASLRNRLSGKYRALIYLLSP